MFERWMPERKPEIKESNSGSATELAELESQRDALMTWMKHDPTPDDARLLDKLNRQIQALEEQSDIRE